jgi:hypothetical protein
VARDGRDETRAPESTRLVERPAVSDERRPTVPMDRVTLRPGPEREPIQHRDKTYRLRDADIRLLAAVGTFRVIRADDLQAMRSSRDVWNGDLRHLQEQGLLESKTVTINRELTAVVVLTRDGKSLLDAHQDRADQGRPQIFHAGLVKPRELAHDAQLHRLFQAEASRIEAAGGRVTRVALDYELKRDYQTFLNRSDRPGDVTHEDDLATFAAQHELPIVDGHLELPDLRIEYEGANGDALHRDVELVTEHYSRAQLAGKAQAGFALYRAAGASRRGGTPIDPHHLEWIG